LKDTWQKGEILEVERFPSRQKGKGPEKGNNVCVKAAES
jgi:hypothetical protein